MLLNQLPDSKYETTTRYIRQHTNIQPPSPSAEITLYTGPHRHTQSVAVNNTQHSNDTKYMCYQTYNVITIQET